MSEIIPEGFDLKQALQAPSTTPPAERPRCPECKLLTVRRKTDKPGDRQHPEEFYCNRKDCGFHFDEPVYFADTAAANEAAANRGVGR